MAIDANNNALSLEQITLLTKTYEPDILESASLVNDDVFEKLRIKVYRNLENANSVMIFNRHTGTARRYKPGNLPKSTIGYLSERELKVVLSVDRFYENIQNFREKEPFQVPTLENAYEAEVTRYLLMQGAKSYAGNVRNCLFHGDVKKEGAYELYDGFNAHIAAGIEAGEISAKNQNLVTLEAMDAATTTDQQAYEAYLEFTESWDEKLKAQEEVIVLVSNWLRSKIIRGYIKTYQGAVTLAEAHKDGYKFVDTPNVTLVSHPVFGKGDMMIAYVPYVLEFGSDVENPGHTNIAVDRSPEDFNILVFQVQTAQGVRIRQISSDMFCVSSGKNDPTISMGGEYQTAAEGDGE